MTASEEAKSYGFKSLTQVANFLNLTTECLRQWHKKEHERFLIVLHGCQWCLDKERHLKESDVKC